MNPSDYIELALRKEGPEKLKKMGEKREKYSRQNVSNHNKDSSKEDAMAFLVDHRTELARLEPKIDKLMKNKDVGEFIASMAPIAAVELAAIVTNPLADAKTKLTAIQDLLDRAGHGKVQKHAVASIDATTSRETLIATIMGGKKALEAQGLEITEDDEDQPEDT